MNSTAPPSAADTQWLDLNIEDIINNANDEIVSQQGALSTPTKAPEGIFGRVSRFFKTLGKRKERDGEEKKDARREQVEQAYADAKALGLLPEPKVFVRPHAKPRTRTAHSTPPPSTPVLRPSTSKKDLQKQLRLSKRVSDLEFRLSEARRALSEALGEDVPLVPALPAALPLTPNTSASQDELSPHIYTEQQESATKTSSGKIIKKRKVVTSTSDDDYKPVTTDTDSEYGGEHTSRRNRTTVATTYSAADSKAGTTATSPTNKSHRRARKAGGRLSKKKSNITKEEVVIVIPDGDSVPPIPKVPSGTEGKRVVVSDDGFGGLGHEIF